MGNKKRKEYKPGDKVSFRLTEEYQNEIDWINAQENVSQSILDLIRLHIGQDDPLNSPTPVWAEVLHKQMTNEIHGIRELLGGMIVKASDSIRQETENPILLQEEMEEQTIEGQDVEINSVGLEAALTMMEWA